MNIAFDIRVFLAAETGVGTYFKNLLGQLATLDEQNRYLLFSSSWKAPFPPAKLPAFVNRRLVDARIPVKVLNWLWHPLARFNSDIITVSPSTCMVSRPTRTCWTRKTDSSAA